MTDVLVVLVQVVGALLAADGLRRAARNVAEARVMAVTLDAILTARGILNGGRRRVAERNIRESWALLQALAVAVGILVLLLMRSWLNDWLPDDLIRLAIFGGFLHLVALLYWLVASTASHREHMLRMREDRP